MKQTAEVTPAKAKCAKLIVKSALLLEGGHPSVALPTAMELPPLAATSHSIAA